MTNRSAYTWMLWGFIFLLVNFYLQGVNILPDVVGFILIAVGANQLRRFNPRFQTVYILCFPMMVLTLPNLHQAVQPNGIHFSGAGNPFLLVVGIIAWAILFVVVYNVCKGTAEIALGSFHPELAEQAMVRWNLYVVLQIATGTVSALAWLRMTSIVVTLGVLVLIYAVIVAILFVTWLWQCREKL